MRRSTSLGLCLTATIALAMAACSSDDNNSQAGSGGNGGANSGSGAQSSGDGGDLFPTTTSTGGNMGAGGGCATQSAEATLVKKPVDIIFVIDNSGSMTNEIVGVEDNINQAFATIIEGSGVDYRVIMFARHGSASSGQNICIEAPLSGIPVGGCMPPPNEPVENPPKFFHYSENIGSHNSLCKLLEQWDQPDNDNNHMMGWSALLREEAFKVFVEVTDDGVSCSHNGVNYNDGGNPGTILEGEGVATAFDQALLALSPTHFGTSAERNYRWYSLVGLATKDVNNPDAPWLPADPIIEALCSTSGVPAAGTGYQGLSKITEGLRFPLCEPMFYDTVFNAIAQGVVDGAQVACNFPVPDPPAGEDIDLATVTVQYTPMGMGQPQEFTQVADASECNATSFYIDQAANEIILCPEACMTVQDDSEAKIDIVFQCVGIAN